jgi:hypothetical protein
MPIAVERFILDLLQHSSVIGVWRRCIKVGESTSWVWWTMHDKGLCLYCLKCVHALQLDYYELCVPLDTFVSLDSSSHTVSNEPQFSWDWSNNIWHFHMWSTIYSRGTIQKSFFWFSVNVCYGLVWDLLIGPFILEQYLTAANCLHFFMN